jgi:hypothetical protein
LQAALFSSFLSAFLIFTLNQLKPDNIEISKNILLHISLQLSNSSIPPFVESELSVSVSAATPAVNGMLFTSLALVLIDAFLAILIRSCIDGFERSWKSFNVPEERARAREILLQRIEPWGLAPLLTVLPLLLIISLILFVYALLVILFDFYPPTAMAFWAIISVGLFMALLMTHRQYRPPVLQTDDAEATGDKVDRAETHLAIFNRLFAATSKAAENLPVFITLFNQWEHVPSLRPLPMAEWSQVLPLIQPYLSNASLSKEFGLCWVARLLLCFNFPKEQQNVITALEKHIGNTKGSYSIEQLYIHLLRYQEPDWSLSCRLLPKLEVHSDTVIELRWILNWITYRFIDNIWEFPDAGDDYSSLQDIIPFLHGTAFIIIQNKLVNDEHELFNSLVLVVESLAEKSQRSTKSQTDSWIICERPFISTGDLFVQPKGQWDLIGGLYAASYKLPPSFKHDFTILVILLMIGALSTVEYSYTCPTATDNHLIKPEQDLCVLMDALWETWQAHVVDHHLLIGIAAWLLKRSTGPFHKPPSDAQRSFQDLLDAYDSYTSGNMLLMTSNSLLFIEAALSFSLETVKPADGDSKWEPQTLKLKNSWLVMHIHNTLRRDWRIPGSAMESAAWDPPMGNLHDLHDLHSSRDPRDLLLLLDPRDQLDLVDRLRLLDLRGRDQRDWRDRRDLRGLLDRLDWRNQLDQSNQSDLSGVLDLQSPIELEIIAGQRLDLYDAKALRLDPVALSLFMSPRNKDIFTESRRLILEFFRSTPSAPSPPPHDATGLDLETGCRLCSDFFDCKAIGDLTKWRLLASVVFPEWETLSTRWKDLLAAGVMKVRHRMEDGNRHRVDWMARVTPLLAGEFDLYEFGLSEDNRQVGPLASTHLNMVATVVEHFGGEGLTHQSVRELEELLRQHSAILDDEQALARIRAVTDQVPDALESLVNLFSDQM